MNIIAAEAEQMMVGEEEGGGQVSTPSTPNDHTPSTGVEEVDTTPDIPGLSHCTPTLSNGV